MTGKFSIMMDRFLFRNIAGVLLLVWHISGQVEKQQVYEFESSVSSEQTNLTTTRSEASNSKTLHLVDKNGRAFVELKLCLKPETPNGSVAFYIDDIRYSNDGTSDVVTLRFDGVNIANFTTSENWASGAGWNEFSHSGKLGPKFELRQGEYRLVIIVKTDIHGVELDRVRISAVNQQSNTDIVCGASVSL